MKNENNVGLKTVAESGEVSVSVTFKVEGTLDVHTIFVENQFVPTTNLVAENHKIKLDGDPIKIEVLFVGARGTKIKELIIKINDIDVLKHDEFQLKGNNNRIIIAKLVPYSEIGLVVN